MSYGDLTTTTLLPSSLHDLAEIGHRLCNVTLQYLGPFSFVVLNNFLEEVKQNATDPQQCPYLTTKNNITSITRDVCHFVTRSNKWTWWMYPLMGVWNRLVSLSLPLPIFLRFTLTAP